MKYVQFSLNNLFPLNFFQFESRIIKSIFIITQMYSRIKGTNSIKIYIALYCFCFLCHGLFSCNVGPLIPYLADKFYKDQTDFSFLFVARTIGSIIGISAYRFLQSKSNNLKEHKLLAAFSLLSALPMLIFVNWQSSFGEWIAMIMIGAGTFGLATVANVCMLFISASNPRWLTFGHAFFGIGAFVAPFIIMAVELNMFYINFACYALVVVACLLIKTPKHEANSNDRSSDSQATRQSEGSQQTTLKQGSVKLQILVSLSLFLIVGVQTTFLGWISTYAVVSEVCSKNQATVYVSIFWITSTIFRFANAALKTRSSLKLKFLLGSTLLTAILCLILHSSGYPGTAALMASILFGFSCSAVYPISLAVPNEYGLKFGKQQITNIMSSTVLSMLVISVTGELMKMRISLLFYSFIFMALLQIATAVMMFKTMVQEVNEEKHLKTIQIEDYVVEQLFK